MKKLSETLTELGIAFTFPIRIWDAKGCQTYYEDSTDYLAKYELDDNGYATYFEDSDGYWEKYERDDNGRPIYHEDSNGFWSRWERDADGNMDYYEDSTGVKKGTPKAAIILDLEESIRFAEMLKEEPSQPTPEMQRAIQAYRDSGIERELFS